MEAPRLFSQDKEAGITKWWHYDPDTDRATIQTQQDVTSLLEENQKSFNAYASTDKWGDWTRVASIPITMYFKLLQEGKLEDQKYLTQMFNSNEYQKLRTRPGRVKIDLSRSR